MPEEKTRTLSKAVQDLAKDFKLEDGRVFMPPQEYAKWREQLTRIPKDRRREIGVELIALAVKFHRIAPHGAEFAIVQVANLAMTLLEGEEVGELLKKAGIDLKGAANMLQGPRPEGMSPVLRPGIAPPKK